MPSHFGRPLLTLSLGDLLVSEHLHAPHEQIALHRHEQPYMCIVTAGAYSEISRSRTLQLKEGAVVGHPEGEQHANRFGAEGGRCLNITPLGAWRDNAAWSDWLHGRATGQSIGEYARRQRLEAALQEIGHAPFAEIAARHGFADQAHFTRAVRQATGLTPRAFKKARQVQ